MIFSDYDYCEKYGSGLHYEKITILDLYEFISISFNFIMCAFNMFDSLDGDVYYKLDFI